MWKLLPASVLGVAFMVLTVAMALVTWSIRYDAGDRTIQNFLFVTVFSATPVITAVVLLGRSRKVWQLTCQCFPRFAEAYDVDGKWAGQKRSTYQAGKKLDEVELYETEMKMEISQSWMSMRVRTSRPDTTSVANSFMTDVILNDGSPRFYTVFSGYNFRPTGGDSDHWFGTSRFEYLPEIDSIVGAYCSNRGYLNGGSTAGDFCLKRIVDEGT